MKTTHGIFVILTFAVVLLWSMSRADLTPPPGDTTNGISFVADAEPGGIAGFLAHEEYRGMMVVGLTFVVLLLTILANLLWKKNHVSVYRPYEEALLITKRLKLEDMMSYHQQYNWGSYAAITIGMVLLSVTILVLDIEKLGDTHRVVLSAAVCTMAVSAILLYYADLIHTNTQTPIIPIDRRFRLIDISVQFGTFGAMLMILSVILFICLIEFWVTVVACAIYIAVTVTITVRRRVGLSEFEHYFGLDTDAERAVFGKVLADVKRKQGKWEYVTQDRMPAYKDVNSEPVN